MPWGVLAGKEERDKSGKVLGEGFPDDFRGWQVGKISQEHGILTWVGDEGKKAPELKVGDRVRVWPNHACIMGAGFEYYLIVDSRNPGEEDTVRDVWCRWNGWHNRHYPLDPPASQDLEALFEPGDPEDLELDLRASRSRDAS